MHFLSCCVSWEFLLEGKFPFYANIVANVVLQVSLNQLNCPILPSDQTTLSLLLLPPTLHRIHRFVEITSPLEQLLVSSMDVERSLLRLAFLPLVPCSKHLDGALCGSTSWDALSLALLLWDRRLRRSFSPPTATVNWRLSYCDASLS